MRLLITQLMIIFHITKPVYDDFDESYTVKLPTPDLLNFVDWAENPEFCRSDI